MRRVLFTYATVDPLCFPAETTAQSGDQSANPQENQADGRGFGNGGQQYQITGGEGAGPGGEGNGIKLPVDPTTFEEVRRITVYDDAGFVRNLNELENIKGRVYANVWHTDRIARIDPETGEVVSWIDLTGLLPESMRTGSEDVLNGIAYDAQNDRLFVTGKLWPALFHIDLVPVAGDPAS